MSSALDVLVLGAGPYQLELIRAAVNQGAKVGVVAPRSNYTERYLPSGTVMLRANLRDVEECLHLAETARPQSVVTCGSDIALPVWAAITERLGLPGPSENAAKLSLDKFECKKALIEARIPTANLLEFTSESHQAKSLVASTDSFLKVADSSGSRGIYRLEAGERFDEKLLSIRRDFPYSEVFLEEALTGVEFGAQAVTENGKVIQIYVHADSVWLPSGHRAPVPIGHCFPHPELHDLSDQVVGIAQASARALELETGVLNLDLMSTNSGVSLIEVGARLGATGIPEMLSAAFGINFFELLLEQARAGIGGSWPEVASRAAASRILVSPQTARVRKMPRTEDLPDAASLWFDYEVGDQVPAFETGNHRIGLVVVGADTPKAAADLVESEASRIEQESLDVL